LADDLAQRSGRILEFSVDNQRYGIDLGEVAAAIRDLATGRSSAPWPAPGHFIHRNRRNVIILDLERCLALRQDRQDGRRMSSLLLLDEKVEESCVGILVPGMPSIVTPGAISRASRGGAAAVKTPRKTRRNAAAGFTGRAGSAVQILVLQDLIGDFAAAYG
jgi:chemotaxis signal transduction protein